MVRNRTLRALETMGAAITYEYQWGRDGAWHPNAHAPGKAWLRKLLGDNHRAGVVEIQLFADLQMHPEKFTDEHARDIATLTELKWLVLMDTRLTDDGLARLKALPKLERLDLEGSRVTDEGVAAFLRLRPDVRVFH